MSNLIEKVLLTVPPEMYQILQEVLDAKNEVFERSETGGIYESVSQGEAAVRVNDLFWVVSNEPNEVALLYKKTGLNTSEFQNRTWIEQGIQGESGKPIQLRKTSTHIEWRIEDEVAWTILIGLDELKGDAGKSAYEIWISQGNEGSKQDYLDSLVGEKGDTGSALNILATLNNVSELPLTGQPGHAYVIQGDLWVWGEEVEDFINVGQFKGDPGEKGDKGDPGEKGDKGDPGDQGDAGLSSYEVWLAAGNSGSVEDYLNAIKGDPGSVSSSNDTVNNVIKLTQTEYNEISEPDEKTLYIITN